MGTQQPTNGRLDGWKAISDYLGWHIRTVMRWEVQKGLPIHRVPGGQRHAVYAYKSEIDEWLKLGESPTTRPQSQENSAGDDPSLSLELTQRIDGELLDDTPVDPDTIPNRASRITTNGKKLAFASMGIAILVSCGVALRGFATDRSVHLTGIAQLTDDGTMKDRLVTDGKTLFFSEHKNGRFGIVSLPVSGGATHELQTPFIKVSPVDISTDGRQLLILAGEGQEKERSLWRLTVANGDLKQVGNIMCHAAAWSPDGSAIALASQNAVYLALDQGKIIRALQTFEGVPEAIEWLGDGTRLRVELRDQNTMTFSFWDISFAGHGVYQIASLVPLKTELNEFFNGQMGTDLDDRSFLIGGDTVNAGILVLAKDGDIFHSSYALHELDVSLAGASAIAVDRQNRRIFAIGSAAVQSSPRKEHADIFWFDQNSGEFRPFLPGTGGEYVDFSRDGQWVTYFSNVDRGLHVSRVDGSEGRQILVSRGTIQLPRWSPDGNSIAFMEQLPNKPWRVFVISAKGGLAREAARGDDSQGAPTWSSDGKTLAYGGVECQEMNACAIHTIDIASGRESTVSGSEGLGTARWSPDGRFIAALDSARHRVMLYSTSTHQWKELTSEVNGNDLSWSSDSKSLFASRPTGDKPKIIRIRVPDGKITTALDLSQLSRLQGQFDSWFAIGPGDAIIISREMSTNEIYSISYAE